MMQFPIDEARAWFAEDVRLVAGLESESVVRAFARVPRERFLGPGPWMIRSELDATPRRTPDADPRHVLHNVSVAIDAARDLYNGGPAVVAAWIDALAISPGDRVVHIGCGTGYYSAICAELAGETGHVTAIEIDGGLASQAASNLADWPRVTVVEGNGRDALPREADVVLVHAGASHVLDEWTDVLSPRGRMRVPLTCTLPGMGATLGKGFVLHVTRDGDMWTARAGSMVAIYSLQGLRDERRAGELGSLLMSGRMRSIARLRRDAHPKGPTCLSHGDRSCVSSE